MLTSLLLGLWHALRAGGDSLAPVTGPPALLRLAIRSAAQSGPQRADHRLDRDRQLPDCGDERVSIAADRNRHRRVHADRGIVAAHFR